MSYSLNKNQPQLLKLLNEVNPNHRDDRTKLKIVYDDLMKKIEKRRQVSSQNIQVKCRICNKRHLLYFCNYHNCEICGIRGHQKQICDTPIYYINLLYLCKCDARICKQNRSRLAKENNLLSKNSTHCCYCKNPTKLEDMQQFERRMKCEICITKDNQLGKGKHTITPPTSPRPEKMAKSPEPTNEDEYDPMELIELNPIEESSNNIPNPPTYAQITKADTDTQPKSNPSTSYKHLECLHCGKSNKDNDSKSQFRKIIIDEFTLLCEKCTQLKENMDRYGSTRPIKKCDVCKIQTDEYDSRAGGQIVCSKICNHTLTVVNRVYKDKRCPQNPSICQFMQLTKEKISNVTAIIEEEDMECEYYDENDNYSTQLEKHIAKYFNNEFTDTKDYTEMKDLIYKAEQVIPKKIPVEIVEQIMEPIIKEFNQENYRIHHDVEFERNMENVPQWFQSNPYTPIKDDNPEEWNLQLNTSETDPTGLTIISEIPPKDTKKNDDVINIKITESKHTPIETSDTQRFEELIDKLVTTYKQYNDNDKSQPMEIDQPNQKRLEIPINMVTKENATQTDLPELRDYISLRRHNRLQKAYDDGKIFVDDLRNRNNSLKSQNKKLTERLRHLTNLTIRNARQQETNYQLYMNEWYVCENLTQQVVRLHGILDEQTTEKTYRKFMLKLQQQVVRTKSKQIEELTKKNTKLANEVLELQQIVDERKEWFNPDTSIDVFTPQTRENMNYIIENCESKPITEVVMDPDIAAIFDSIVWNDQLMIENLTVDSD